MYFCGVSEGYDAKGGKHKSKVKMWEVVGFKNLCKAVVDGKPEMTGFGHRRAQK